MAFSVTDFDVCNEIQMCLLEVPNSGASYGSGLYTASEVATALNYRMKDFAKQTGLNTKRDTSITTNANVVDQNLPIDVIDLKRVAYADSNGTIQSINQGSVEEEAAYLPDLYGSNAAVDVPSIYTLDVSGVLQTSFLPPPNASRTIDYIYVNNPSTLPSSPDGTLLEVPDDFTPYIKYGALADLFGKSGEAYDPFRAQICEQFYQLGLQVAQQTVAATNGLE